MLETLGKRQNDFNGAQSDEKRVSLADLIVLGGAAAIEHAAGRAGIDVDVPSLPGRTDPSQAQTDADSIALTEPAADGFRNCFASANPDLRQRCWWRRLLC